MRTLISGKYLTASVALVVFLTAFLWRQPAAALDHYVDNVASCSGLVPCHATIMDAVNSAVPFDTVRVFPGVYHESVTLTSAQSDIVLQAQLPRQAPVIIGSPAVFFDAANRVQVRNFVIEGGLAGSGAPNLGVVIQDNFVTGGINVRLREAVVRGNTVSNPGTGIVLPGTGGTLIEDNLVDAVDGDGISFPIAAQSPASNVIRGNRVRSVSGSGIFMTWEAAFNTIENNVVSGSGGDGIFLAADGATEFSVGNLVRRNTSVENGGCDIREAVPPDPAAAPPGAIWRNNRFFTKCGRATN